MAQDPRACLEALKAELVALSQASTGDRQPVELDQQSVGRLSRLDAMQVQAMARASDVRRIQEIRRIEAALKRVDEDEYGWCVECGEAIEPKRLDIDAAAARCAGCA
jgi:DnaK suppressor protein